jgi:hypothetical protein
MGTRSGKHHVRLADGTLWALDYPENDEDSLEWVLRYGSPAMREEQRLIVASIVASYKALINCGSQRRRNEVVREILYTLHAATETGSEDR